MKIYSLSLLLIFCIWGNATTLKAQKNHTRVYEDSLLNELINIDKRIKEVTIKDTTKGYVTRHIQDSIAKEEKIRFQSSLDTLYARNSDGLLILPHTWTPFDENIWFNDTIIYDPRFLPVVFDGKVLPDNLEFYSTNKQSATKNTYHLLNPDETLAADLDKINRIDEIRQYYYQNHPEKIKSNALDFENKPVITQKIVEKKNIFDDLLSTDDAINIVKPEVESIKIKRRYWLVEGENTLQLSLNEFSEKWGGTNNFNLFAYNRVNLNYKKNKVNFNNLIEWRLNLQNNEADTMRNVGVTDDLFKTYSTFSINAPIKNWFYSTNLEMKSPLLNRYKLNTNELNRAFLSPFELNLGVGLRYNIEKKYEKNPYRKLRISADISVLSLNYKSVEDGRIKPEWFGIEKDKFSKTDYGSTYNFSINYDRNRLTSFSSRIKYFTNYEKVYVECENSANFTLNRYFSTTIYLYVKYDDGVGYKNKDKKYGYFMYNQMLRFGLTYRW